MSDKMREEFEEWAVSCDMCTYLDDIEYRHQSTEWAWRAWQASRAAMVWGGWQIVPVEPTGEMVSCGEAAWWDGGADSESIVMAYRAMLAEAPKP